MSSVVVAGSSFLREHLRTRLTLVLLIAIPALFVTASAGVLEEFADALGGAVAGASASALGAGWAAAFLAGTLGFFQISSSREADRRLSLAGLGPGVVATARMGAAIALGLVVTATAFATLVLRTGIEHPGHAFVAIFAFALIYIAIGALIGSLVEDALEGSLAVALVFLVDVFSGPGMTASGGAAEAMPTRTAAEVLIDAGAGTGSPAGDWLAVALTAVGALAVAFGAFWLQARARA